MRTILAFILLAFATLAAADSFTLHPTYPGTSLRDHSKPGWRVDPDRGTVEPLVPGTTFRDFGRSGYQIERRGGRTKLNPTLPGTSIRDFSKPGLVVE